MDASPWGLGAVLFVDGRPQRWLASPLTEADVQTLGHPLGSSTGQQTWECLVLLVSLREWLPAWQLERAHLEVRSDSVAALTMAMHLKVYGTGPGIIARELAMVIGCATFRPDVFSHVPGLANVTADALSRRYEPGVSFRLPALLSGVT